jgi:hypothetical protein
LLSSCTGRPWALRPLVEVLRGRHAAKRDRGLGTSRGLRRHLKDRVLVHGNKTVVFR